MVITFIVYTKKPHKHSWQLVVYKIFDYCHGSGFALRTEVKHFFGCGYFILKNVRNNFIFLYSLYVAIYHQTQIKFILI